MIIDFEKVIPEPLICDVCVVGGGAIGLVMASELAQKGIDVLVLEGGGPTLEGVSQALHRGHSVGHPFSNIDVGRYRVLGGTTIYWGGQVIPFNRAIIGNRSWVGHEEWPVDPDELDNYFHRAYQVLGLGDAILEDNQVWSRIGGEKPMFGENIDLITTRWCKTRNFSKLFGETIRNNQNLRVLTHCNAVALRLRSDSRTVESIAVRSLGGRNAEVHAKRFILANGTLEISRLLMHPLVDGSVAPWARSRFLGTPFIDHLEGVVGCVEIIDHALFHHFFDSIFLAGHKYFPRMQLSESTQHDEGLLDIAAHFLYKTRFTEHLEYLKMFLRSIKDGGTPVSVTELPKHIASVISTSLPLAMRYFKDRRSFKPRDAEVSLTVSCEQFPLANSRLSLSDEIDDLGMKRLKVDWQIDGRELITIRRFALIIKNELETRQIARITIDPLLLDLDRKFLEKMDDGIHQMGTTRMGKGPDDGFVDSNLKVFGISNLFIAGAAVFPSSGFANPTFTAIALALKLSDHLEGIQQ